MYGSADRGGGGRKSVHLQEIQDLAIIMTVLRKAVEKYILQSRFDYRGDEIKRTGIKTDYKFLWSSLGHTLMPLILCLK